MRTFKILWQCLPDSPAIKTVLKQLLTDRRTVEQRDFAFVIKMIVSAHSSTQSPLGNMQENAF